MRRIAFLLLVAACGGDGGTAGTWTGTVDTLANGAVRVRNPATGVEERTGGTAGRPAPAPVPELVIGRQEAPEATEFVAISGLEVDEAGRIYVLDQTLNQLRIFAPDGTLIRSVGREGEGPGEYTAANGLRLLPPDSLLVIDQQANRYMILTRDGDFVRTVKRELPFHRWMFQGDVIDGRVYEYFAVPGQEGEDWTPALMGTSLGDSVPMDTIFVPTALAIEPGPRYESFSVTGGGGGMYLGVPFAPQNAYELDGERGIWFATGSEFRLIHASLAGDTLMEILVDGEPAPVTEAEIAEWRESDAPQRFLARGGKLDLDRIPATKPHLDDIYVAPEGELWVSVPAGPLETVFAVFDADGRLLGRLKFDGFERTPWISPVVRDGRLYVVGKDDLDIERVYVFGLEDAEILD